MSDATKGNKHMKTLTNIIHTTLAAFGCFALSQTAQALNPPPDGAIPARIRLRAHWPCLALQPALATQRLDIERCTATQADSTTRPLG
jgi:hypothetical protein